MRPWVDHLISNEAACEDFLSFVKDAKESLNVVLKERVLAGELAEAQAIASEISIYDSLAKKIKTELNERRNVVYYNDANKKEE